MSRDKPQATRQRTTVPPSSTADNRFFCAEHKTNWTKKTGKDGKSWYSHKNGDGWCNQPKDELRIGADNQPSDASLPIEMPWEGGEAVSVDASGLPASAGELLTRAVNQLGYRNRAEVFAVLKVASIIEVKDIGVAWQQLVEATG